MKYLITLIFVFSCSTVYSQAVTVIRSHNQLTGTGTNSHATLDTFVSSKGQANGLASLDASGNLVQVAGTVTLSGGYVKQTNGTATGAQLTSVQIVSGTGTLSAATIAGIDAPYIKQSSGTGTGLTLSGTNIINGVTAPYIAQNNGTGTVSSITSTGNVNLLKDGQNRIIIKRSTIGSDALSLAMISIYGSDTTGAETNYANIEASIGSATDNQESGKIALWTMRDGFIDERLSITGTSAAFGGSGNKVDVDVYGTITARDGVKFSDNSTLLSGNIVKGIVAGSGISIDQSTGTVTINASGSTGGWTDGTNTVYVTVAADQVIIGSTTATGSDNLSVTGTQEINNTSEPALGLYRMATGTANLGVGIFRFWGRNNINTTDRLYGSIETQATDPTNGSEIGSIIFSTIDTTNGERMRIRGEKVLIGTTTAGTALNVGGTVTATGFSGNGAGLTNLSTAFSAVMGSATASQLPIDLSSIGTITIKAINGSSTAHGQAYRTTSFASANNTWEDVPMNGGDNNLYNVSHSTVTNPERMTVLTPGVYYISGGGHLRNSPTMAGFRMCKNGTEIPGSFATEGISLGDGNQTFYIKTSCITSLAVNDYISLQLIQASGSGDTVLDIYTSSITPTTWIYAVIDLFKIGE